MKLYELYCFERQMEKIDRSLYGSWISPTGDVYPVKRFGHVEFVTKNIKMFPITKEQYPLLKTNNDVYTLAFAAGWVRVNHSVNSEIDFEGLITSFKNLQSVIEPSINQRDVGVVNINKKRYPNEESSSRSFDVSFDKEQAVKWMTM